MLMALPQMQRFPTSLAESSQSFVNLRNAKSKAPCASSSVLDPCSQTHSSKDGDAESRAVFFLCHHFSGSKSKTKQSLPYRCSATPLYTPESHTGSSHSFGPLTRLRRSFLHSKSDVSARRSITCGNLPRCGNLLSYSSIFGNLPSYSSRCSNHSLLGRPWRIHACLSSDHRPIYRAHILALAPHKPNIHSC